MTTCRDLLEFDRADEIRSKLNELDIVIEDAEAGGGKYTFRGSIAQKIIHPGGEALGRRMDLKSFLV